MIYGYARCSTSETKQDINRQRRELQELGAEEIYQEYESGTKINRPELEKLLRHIKPGDTIVTTEISRITRSTRQLCEIIDLAIANRLKLIIGGFIVDCTANNLDPMTQGMLKMMGVFAELERNMTVERVRSGLRNARAKGVRLGRPALTIKDIPRKVTDYYNLYKSGQLSKTDYAKLCGISRPSLYKYLSIMADR